MKRIAFMLVAIALATSAMAQGDVKTNVKTSADGSKKVTKKVKNEATGAATTTETVVRPNGSKVTATTHKTGRTKVGQGIHKAHMKVKKAV